MPKRIMSIMALAIVWATNHAQSKDFVTGSIIINEIMAANVDVYLDPSYNYGSWVELYNPTDESVSLGGLYVSDNPKDLKKHRLMNNYDVLPAHGYALLNFDHHEVWKRKSYRQIDDKLDYDGGTIIISDGTTILAQQDYPQAISRTSYARTKDGGDTWGITGNPSPGSSNEANSGFAEIQLEAPVVDQDAQIFSSPLLITVSFPKGQGYTLKYTTDGTTPTLTNGMVSRTGVFETENKSVCYRFRLFKEGFLPSPVVTRSYIYNNGNEPFPIISVVTDPQNLYSSSYGVFERGDGNGRPGNGQSNPCNWNMDWDRPVSFDYITTDNKCLISQECDLSMCGGWTRSSTPHSFKLKAKKVYDSNSFFQVHLFDAKPYIKSKTLQIRNGGNDNSGRIKDPSIQQIVARSGLYVDYQEWQPVHVYINGESYAVLNMREPNNKDFAESNYGIDTDEMDQFEINPDSNYVQMRGTEEAYLRLINLSENAADESTYKEIEKLLDIDEYINYMAVELYTGNWDWPQNNTKGFRDRNDGKFHFVLFDLDGALSTDTPFNTFFGKEKNYELPIGASLHGYDYSKSVSIEGKKFYADITFVTLFRNMLKNEDFRKKFIDTFCIMGGSVFQPTKVETIVNEMANYLSLGGYVNPWGSANNVISGFRSRNRLMTSHLKNTADMRLSDVTRQSVKFSADQNNAKIMLNDIEVPYNEFNGYLFAPVTLKAIAPVGYRFVGWKNEGSTKTTSVFATGEKWKYYDQGSLDGKNWTASSYSDTKWKEGAARIGYDYNKWHTGLLTETEGYLPTYYFRKSFNLNNATSSSDELILEYTIDDGIIVYVNGIEAGRYNMPSGDVSYNTFAADYAHDNPDTGQMTLKGSLFKKGENVIAVEVHNNSSTSSDILWDASLSLIEQIDGEGFASENAEYTLPSTGTHKVIAAFEKISEKEMIAEGITPVRINEVSAANSIYVNDYFKKNDWIELYNTTDEPIDIKGMYISDNIKKPEKYQVPTDDENLNTIIPAHGYKVIWCDKLDNIGTDIHTSFKLASEGGDIVITTKNYSDVFTYGEHLGTQTFGRYPDGGNDTYVMNVPTIAKANAIGSYDELYVKPKDPDPNDIRSYTKEGGITIAYVNGTVNIKSEDAAINLADIYNLSGMKMQVTRFSNSGNHMISFSTAELPRGVYIVRATTEDGDECHIKFFIK